MCGWNVPCFSVGEGKYLEGQPPPASLRLVGLESYHASHQQPDVQKHILNGFLMLDHLKSEASYINGYIKVSFRKNKKCVFLLHRSKLSMST